MLLPEIKEREYRFRLALRIGLPIFALVLALISGTLISTYQSLQPSFYVISILLLAFSIYFILFLIYNGFDVRITESVSKTFTRDYLYDYLNKDIKRSQRYTLVLISIDNLNDINSRYGIKTGDKIISKVVKYIEMFFKDKKIENFPMGHLKGGDFIIGFKGEKENYNSLIELLSIKSSELKVDEIEVEMSAYITDTSISKNLDYLVEHLLDRKKIKQIVDDINPDDVESSVINAVASKSIFILTQNIYNNSKVVARECFIKIKTKEGNILHPKNYMKVVNRLGLNVEYDYMILEKCISNCVNESSESFAIAISPTSIRNNKFIDKIKDLISNNPHAKGRIIFILSESQYYSQIDKYNNILKTIKNLGIKIAIDRVGSLHTSFLYLRDLEIDIARFDSFYSKDMKTKKYFGIVKGLNTMTHSKGVKSWIKMVEDKQTYDLAQELNIDFIQGKELSELEKLYEG